MQASTKIELSLSPTELFDIPYFTDTLFATLLVVAALIILAVIVRFVFVPKWRKNIEKVGPFQMFCEWIVNMVNGTAKDTVGRNYKFVGGFYTSMMIFIFCGIMVEFVGLRSPLSDLNLTFMFGLLTFVLVHYFGFKERRLKRALHYINLLFDVSDLIVPISIGLRLFGNVFSGYAVMHMIHALPTAAFAVLLPFVLILFTLFHAIIQSYVYMVLSCSFISEATEGEHPSTHNAS